jgi:hypothetical protein
MLGIAIFDLNVGMFSLDFDLPLFYGENIIRSEAEEARNKGIFRESDLLTLYIKTQIYFLYIFILYEILKNIFLTKYCGLVVRYSYEKKILPRGGYRVMLKDNFKKFAIFGGLFYYLSMAFAIFVILPYILTGLVGNAILVLPNLPTENVNTYKILSYVVSTSGFISVYITIYMLITIINITYLKKDVKEKVKNLLREESN